MKCDLKCPPMTPKYYCCRHCKTSRKDFVNENNKNLWSEELGFWSETGCRLTENKRPKECIDFNCKELVFSAEIYWNDGWILGVASNSRKRENV